MVTTARPDSRHDALPSTEMTLESAIEEAWALIPPNFTLKSFVAVNPFLGLVDRPFAEAALEIDRIHHARMTLPLEAYRERSIAGEITEADLGRAGREVEDRAPASLEPLGPRIHAYASAIDGRAKSDWRRLVVEEISKWCAARFDAGQAAWKMPFTELRFWEAWREIAAIDRGAELAGLTGLRAYAAKLPRDPRDAIAHVLAELDVPAEAWRDYLARALLDVKGWSGHVRHLTREAGMKGLDDDDLQLDFLAIRVAYDGAIRNTLGPEAPTWRVLTRDFAEPGHDGLLTRLTWHTAFEGAYRRRLLDRLRGGSSLPAAQPALLQAAFCIDVRSEILRRHLERLSPRVRTLGFAGFFGFPVALRRLGEEGESARCPALIAPPYAVREVVKGGEAATREGMEVRARERADHARFLSTRLSTVSSFSFAETLGGWFGLRILTDTVGATHPQSDGAYFPSKLEGRLEPEADVHEAEGQRFGLTLEEQIDLAEGALRGMGLTDDFAEVVLLCGHGSATANNPYGSGLDCGACGGHAGDVNARLAASVLEAPEVRAGLRERGIDIPDATRFVAGLHITTTDEVRLFDADRLSAATRQRIETWLAEAGQKTREERLPGLTRGQEQGLDALQETRRRARDWSEVRPEWGLARNAAFVAARRERTRGVDLGGRVFLHDYDPAKDPERKVLEVVLTAPMVVASWINLQYLASSVDNEAFGSGNKLIHNVVGRHGVMQGNRGDLGLGLPFQSVHDGEKLYHEPIRLQVVVEAPRADLDAILARHEHVRQLVENEWIYLMAWEGDDVFRRHPDGKWRAEDAS